MLLHPGDGKDISVRQFIGLLIVALVLAIICGGAYMVLMPVEPGPYERPSIDPTQSVYDKERR